MKNSFWPQTVEQRQLRALADEAVFQQTVRVRCTTNPCKHPSVSEENYLFNVGTGQTQLNLNNKQPISNPCTTWLFLKLETNTGLSDQGEGSGVWISPIVRTALHQWEEPLVGRNPLDVTTICGDITNRLPWKDGP